MKNRINAVAASLLLVVAIGFTSCQKKPVVVPEEYCEELVKLAEEGNAEAQAKLGKCYLYGDSVELSYPAAVEWLTKAANQGNAEAQLDLGKCYIAGLGIEQSKEKGLELIKKSVDQGNADAQYYLGECYSGGKLLPQSYEKAFELYRKAADQGNANGQAALGVCYHNGFGVEQSYAKAVELFKEAQGKSSIAKYWLGVCMATGNGIEKNFDEGIKLIHEAAKDGFAPAQVEFGNFCFNHGNYDTATTWFVSAAIKGHPQGIDAINTWIKQRAKNGFAEAQFWMGRYCESIKEYEQAISWYTLASKQGHADAPKALQALQAELQNQNNK